MKYNKKYHRYELIGLNGRVIYWISAILPMDEVLKMDKLLFGRAIGLRK